MLSVNLRAIQRQIKLAVIRRHLDRLDALHQFLARAPILDQVRDGAQLEAMFCANFINAGNRAIVPSSFMISQITPMGRANRRA
jgi:hypothetical protein